MKYLLDTCTISELTREKPQASVIEWVAVQREENLFLSVLTLGEIQKGIGRLSDGKGKIRLQAWLDEHLRRRFHGRILPVDEEVATRWGLVAAAAERRGMRIPVFDGLIAATALVSGMIVVTRNSRDMAASRVPVVDPWSGTLP